MGRSKGERMRWWSGVLLGLLVGNSPAAAQLSGVLVYLDGTPECLKQACTPGDGCDDDSLTCRMPRDVAADRGLCGYSGDNVVCMTPSADGGCDMACPMISPVPGFPAEAWLGTVRPVALPDGSDVCLCMPRGALDGCGTAGGTVWAPPIVGSRLFCGLRTTGRMRDACFRNMDGNLASYLEGDCDGDGVPNRCDACPCVGRGGALTDGAMCGMSGCPPCPVRDGGAGDASTGTDGGTVADAGVAVDGAVIVDAGAGTDGGHDGAVVDASAGDAATSRDGAGGTSEGATVGSPDGSSGPGADGGRGVGFEGGGGCACGVARGAEGTWFPVLALLGLLGVRRSRSRARSRHARRRSSEA